MKKPNSIYEKSKYQIVFYKQELVTPHFHSNVELKFVLEGSIRATLNGKEYVLTAGKGFIVFPFELHSYRDIDSKWNCLIHYAIDANSTFSSIFREKRPVSPVLDISDYGFLSGLLNDLHGYFRTMPESQLRYETKKGFSEGILGLVLSKLPLCDAPSVGNGRTIEKIISYIAGHFSEPITIEGASKELFISERQISRVISERFGTSFRGFINSLRIQRAIDLLTTTNDSVSTIAYECGFESLCTFNRVFRTYAGMPPTALRGANAREQKE